MAPTEIQAREARFGKMSIIRIGFLGIVLLIVLFTLLGSFYTVEQGERAVLSRFGEAVAVEEPGLHFKLPWAESITIMSIREQRSGYKMETYSKDQQPAQIIVSVNYQLLPSEVMDVYSRLGTDYIEKLLTTQLPKRTKEVFGQFTAEQIVGDRVRLGREVETSLQSALDTRGVQIVSVQVEDVSFSDAYERSIEERMQAQVASVKAEADKKKRMTDADAAAYEVTAAANADAAAMKLRGEAEAFAIQKRAEALKGNQELVALTAVQKWDGVLPTTQVPGAAMPFITIPKQ